MCNVYYKNDRNYNNNDDEEDDYYDDEDGDFSNENTCNNSNNHKTSLYVLFTILDKRINTKKYKIVRFKLNQSSSRSSKLETYLPMES